MSEPPRCAKSGLQQPGRQVQCLVHRPYKTVFEYESQNAESVKAFRDSVREAKHHSLGVLRYGDFDQELHYRAALSPMWTVSEKSRMTIS